MNRLLGSGNPTPFLAGDMNLFRTSEILDEDNVYNRQALKLAQNYVNSLSVNQEKEAPNPVMTDAEKYQVNLRINNFLNAIDAQIAKYYDNVSDTNTGDLIPKWNALVLYYSLNVNPVNQNYIDMQLQGDPTDKVKIIQEMADTSDYTDSNDVDTLYNYMRTKNYKTIRTMLYSSKADVVPETQFVDKPIYEIPPSWYPDVRKLLIQNTIRDEPNLTEAEAIKEVDDTFDDTISGLDNAGIESIAKQIGKKLPKEKVVVKTGKTIPKLSPFEKTLLPSDKPEAKAVRRRRKVPLGRPRKDNEPQTEEVFLGPVSKKAQAQAQAQPKLPFKPITLKKK